MAVSPVSVKQLAGLRARGKKRERESAVPFCFRSHLTTDSVMPRANGTNYAPESPADGYVFTARAIRGERLHGKAFGSKR